MRKLVVLLSIVALSGCTFTTPRYSISADNNAALRAKGASSVSVGPFTRPRDFNNNCRGTASISPPDGMGFEQYVQKALTDELKVAGLYDDKAPKVVLTGALEHLSFSSSSGLTGGIWDMRLRVNSSNGRSTSVTEHYEFKSGFVGDLACRQTAEAYFPAVQDLIGKLVKSPDFQGLVAPPSS